MLPVMSEGTLAPFFVDTFVNIFFWVTDHPVTVVEFATAGNAWPTSDAESPTPATRRKDPSLATTES